MQYFLFILLGVCTTAQWSFARSYPIFPQWYKKSSHGGSVSRLITTFELRNNFNRNERNRDLIPKLLFFNSEILPFITHESPVFHFPVLQLPDGLLMASTNRDQCSSVGSNWDRPTKAQIKRVTAHFDLDLGGRFTKLGQEEFDDLFSKIGLSHTSIVLLNTPGRAWDLQTNTMISTKSNEDGCPQLCVEETETQKSDGN